MGDAARAVNDYLVRALTLQNQLHSEPGQAETLNAMGVAYHQLGRYPEALEKYSTAAAIRRRLGDQRGLATSLKNRARVYVAMGRFGEATPDLHQARRSTRRSATRMGWPASSTISASCTRVAATTCGPADPTRRP